MFTPGGEAPRGREAGMLSEKKSARRRRMKKKKKISRPAAGGRPEAGSEIHIVLALGPAGQIFGSEVHIVRSSWGPLF